MLFHENGFIGHNPNESLLFSGTDSKETFNENLNTLPSDWYYKTAEITYNYNSLGHRSVEYTDLDLNNYILFTGCSNTEGIGLEIEKSYSYLVSKGLGCDYYNLALGGTGIDIMTHNLVRWAHYADKMPKVVVIQWSSHLRFMTLNVDNRISLRMPNDKKIDTRNFILSGEDCSFFISRLKAYRTLLDSVYAKCRIIHVGVPGFDINPLDKHALLESTDFARDRMHPGNISNENLARDIVALLR